jgi:hypothetical protein
LGDCRKPGKLSEGTLKVGWTVSRQILHCLGGQWVRLERVLPDHGFSLVADVPDDEDVVCDGSVFGASSGSYQPGMG